MKTAVKEWCEVSGKVEAKYEHISGWDTSDVTVMGNLFRGTWRGPREAAEQFNDDNSRWNVGRMENMKGMF